MSPSTGAAASLRENEGGRRRRFLTLILLLLPLAGDLVRGCPHRAPSQRRYHALLVWSGWSCDRRCRRPRRPRRAAQEVRQLAATGRRRRAHQAAPHRVGDRHVDERDLRGSAPRARLPRAERLLVVVGNLPSSLFCVTAVRGRVDRRIVGVETTKLDEGARVRERRCGGGSGRSRRGLARRRRLCRRRHEGCLLGAGPARGQLPAELGAAHG